MRWCHILLLFPFNLDGKPRENFFLWFEDMQKVYHWILEWGDLVVCISSNLDVILFFFNELDKNKYGQISVILLKKTWLWTTFVFWLFSPDPLVPMTGYLWVWVNWCGCFHNFSLVYYTEIEHNMLPFRSQGKHTYLSFEK